MSFVVPFTLLQENLTGLELKTETGVNKMNLLLTGKRADFRLRLTLGCPLLKTFLKWSRTYTYHPCVFSYLQLRERNHINSV